MGVSIQDRTDFLNMLDACRTEQQLFSRLTFAVMFHQTDPDAREDLLDDVRGAACNMQLPAVNYKIDQWLNTCKQAWQADPAAFMAAVNADAKQRKLALEGSAAQPGLLADVPMQSVAWLVPQLLPLGDEVHVYPGHGPETTLGHETLYNPFIVEVLNHEVNYRD